MTYLRRMRKKAPAILVTLIVVVATSFFIYPHKADSANLTIVKDTLQTSRLSFAGRVIAPTVAGSSQVFIYTTGTSEFYSISTAGLKVGDSLVIGGTNTYTIASIVADNQFNLTTTLAAGDADDLDSIYLKIRPQHVITFNTTSAIANGFFRVLIRSAATNFNNNIPDATGFDFGGGTVDLAASPSANYTFNTSTGMAATVSGTGACTTPANFHCFEFHYSGTGAVGTPIMLTIGNTDGSDTPIAPAPASTHTEASADTYTIYVQNFDSGDDPSAVTPIDQTTGKVGLIESVRVTATVDPSITFTIAGVTSGGYTCATVDAGTDNLIDIDTTTGSNAPLAVPFGSLSLNTFKDAAHLLTVTTNAVNGYIVTAQENDQLGKDGGTSPFIPDTSGDSGTATESVSDTWDTATGNPGFGYTLKSVAGATVPFDSTTAIFNTRRFPSIADADSPLVQTIMSNTAPTDTDQINVCYRISVDASQAAGDYENQITYTATASF